MDPHTSIIQNVDDTSEGELALVQAINDGDRDEKLRPGSSREPGEGTEHVSGDHVSGKHGSGNPAESTEHSSGEPGRVSVGTEPSDGSIIVVQGFEEPEAETHLRPARQLRIEASVALPRFLSSSLYIADLDTESAALEERLFATFSGVGIVRSLKICEREVETGFKSLGFGYVNFDTVEEAALAWTTLNYTSFNGTPIRLLFSNLNATSRYNLKANIVVKNLEESIDSEALHHTFSVFGVIMSCKVPRDAAGQSMGYGFIQFEDERDAEMAIRLVNGKVMEDKQVYVGPFIPRSMSQTEAAQIMAQSRNASWNMTVESATTLEYEAREFRKSIDEICYRNNTSSRGTRSTYSSGNTQTRAAKLRPRKEKTSREQRRKLLKATHAAKQAAAEEADAADEAAQEAAKTAMKTCCYADLVRRGPRCSYADSVRQEPPEYVPSSDPWAPQPWSVDILKANLSSAHFPEERLAMLGGTFFPLVSKYTLDFVSNVTNVLVKLDIKEIVHLMQHPQALEDKVEKTKQLVLQDLAKLPYIPTAETASPPELTAAASPADSVEALASESAMSADSRSLFNAPGHFPLIKGTPGTGFFDVSLVQNLQILKTMRNIGSASLGQTSGSTRDCTVSRI